MNKSKFETRELECKITEKERKEITQRLCEKINEQSQVLEEKKQVNSEFKMRLQEIENVIHNSSTAVLTGYERRPVECKVLLNEPEDGKKTIIRKDTGEEYTVEDMTQEELQEEIDFSKN